MTNAPPVFTEADFRKASRSEPDKECVHVARNAEWFELRDSKTAFGAADDQRLTLTSKPGLAFFGAVKAGRFDS